MIFREVRRDEKTLVLYNHIVFVITVKSYIDVIIKWKKYSILTNKEISLFQDILYICLYYLDSSLLIQVYLYYMLSKCANYVYLLTFGTIVNITYLLFEFS